jgi:hypothetical protein
MAGMDRVARREFLLARYHRRQRCLWLLAWTYHIVGWLLILVMVAAFAGSVFYYQRIHRP